jgi:hypothetical protein
MGPAKVPVKLASSQYPGARLPLTSILQEARPVLFPKESPVTTLLGIVVLLSIRLELSAMKALDGPLETAKLSNDP